MNAKFRTLRRTPTTLTTFTHVLSWMEGIRKHESGAPREVLTVLTIQTRFLSCVDSDELKDLQLYNNSYQPHVYRVSLVHGYFHDCKYSCTN